jgi:hypothetical protein
VRTVGLLQCSCRAVVDARDQLRAGQGLEEQRLVLDRIKVGCVDGLRHDTDLFGRNTCNGNE